MAGPYKSRTTRILFDCPVRFAAWQMTLAAATARRIPPFDPRELLASANQVPRCAMRPMTRPCARRTSLPRTYTKRFRISGRQMSEARGASMSTRIVHEGGSCIHGNGRGTRYPNPRHVTKPRRRRPPLRRTYLESMGAGVGGGASRVFGGQAVSAATPKELGMCRSS